MSRLIFISALLQILLALTWFAFGVLAGPRLFQYLGASSRTVATLDAASPRGDCSIGIVVDRAFDGYRVGYDGGTATLAWMRGRCRAASRGESDFFVVPSVALVVVDHL